MGLFSRSAAAKKEEAGQQCEFEETEDYLERIGKNRIMVLGEEGFNQARPD